MIDYDHLKIVWNRGTDSLKDEQGRYALPPGQFPSVTKVLDGSNDFLWVHLKAIEKEVTDLLAAEEQGVTVDAWIESDDGWVRASVPPSVLLKDGAYLSKSGLRYMKQAADRGTGVHFLFEAWGEGIRPDAEDARELAEWACIEQNMRADRDELALYYGSAIRWLDRWQPVFQYQELVVCDPYRGYAGRCDIRLVEIEGVLYGPADIKSHDDWKRSWAMQMGAYQKAPMGYIKQESGPPIMLEIEQEWKTLPGLSIMVTKEKAGHRVIEPWLMDYYYQKFVSQLDAYQGQSGPLPKGRAKWIKQ